MIKTKNLRESLKGKVQDDLVVITIKLLDMIDEMDSRLAHLEEALKIKTRLLAIAERLEAIAEALELQTEAK